MGILLRSSIQFVPNLCHRRQHQHRPIAQITPKKFRKWNFCSLRFSLLSSASTSVKYFEYLWSIFIPDFLPLLRRRIFWGAAIAQWIRLRLPSCRPGFESQAHQQCFFKFILFKLYICHLIWNVKRTKLNEKLPGLAHFFKKINSSKFSHFWNL